MTSAKYSIELKNITKTFGDVIANKDVNLNVKQGEILALLGENGSGKTTLMNMLSGIYKPDSGSIYVDGNEVVINSPEDSKRLQEIRLMLLQWAGTLCSKCPLDILVEKPGIEDFSRKHYSKAGWIAQSM